MLAVRGTPFLGDGDAEAARQILACERIGRRGHVLGRAAGHKVAALLAGSRAEVDDVVGAADGLLIVLHHEYRVAQIAQVLERL